MKKTNNTEQVFPEPCDLYYYDEGTAMTNSTLDDSYPLGTTVTTTNGICDISIKNSNAIGGALNGTSVIADTKPTINIGKYILDEDMLEKLSIVLDIMDEDPKWSERIKTQQAFNRLQGE